MASSKKVNAKKVVVKKVSVKCKVLNDGYFGGKVLKPGQVFLYDGNLKDGKFPKWCKPLKKSAPVLEEVEEVEDEDDLEEDTPSGSDSVI